MAKKTLTIHLSEKSFENAIKEIENYENRIVRLTKRLTEVLASAGMEFAKLEIVDMQAIFKGELLESIVIEPRGESKISSAWAFVANSEHAAFVEFGTGYRGKDEPYKYKLPIGVKWDYVVGEQVLANAEKGIYGWFYKDETGALHFCEGMASRPFMTNAYYELLSRFKDMALEVFKEE